MSIANKVEPLTTYKTKPVQRPLVPDNVQKINIQDTNDQKLLLEELAVTGAAKVQVSTFELCSKQLLEELQDTGQEIQKIRIPQAKISSRADAFFDYSIPEAALTHGKCIVIADDEFCGAYLGELVRTRTTQMDYKFAHVRIIEMLRYPLQHAIFNKSAEIKREPYETGSEHSFDLGDIRFLFEATDSTT